MIPGRLPGLLGSYGTSNRDTTWTEDRIRCRILYLPPGTLQPPSCGTGYSTASCMFERNGSTQFHSTARMHVLLRAAGGPNGLEVQLEREAGSPSSVAASPHTTSTLLTGPPSLHLEPVAVDDGSAYCTVASVPRLCQPNQDGGPRHLFLGRGQSQRIAASAVRRQHRYPAKQRGLDNQVISSSELLRSLRYQAHSHVEKRR